MSNEVITFFPEIQTLLKLLMVLSASSFDAEDCKVFQCVKKIKDMANK